jgi:putative transcriptional regulator
MSSREGGTDVRKLVKQLRDRLQMTQEQFAHKVGVTYSTVNHWENGKRLPLPFLVKRLLEMKQELDDDESKAPKGKTPR